MLMSLIPSHTAALKLDSPLLIPSFLKTILLHRVVALDSKMSSSTNIRPGLGASFSMSLRYPSTKCPMYPLQDFNQSLGDVVLEVQTITHFLEAAVTGTMPNNRRTDLPLLSLKECTENFEKDYSQWAQGSYQSLRGTPSCRVMQVLASKEDPSRLVS